VSFIVGVFTKGLDDGSQDISVRIGTIVAVAVGDGVLVCEGVKVEEGTSCVGVGKITVLLQPARKNVIISEEI